MHDEEQWRQGLGVGDSVAVCVPSYHREPEFRLVTVTKAEKRFVTAGGMKFHRSVGYVVGYDKQHTSYQAYVAKPTEQRLEPKRWQAAFNKCKDAFAWGGAGHKVTIAQLERIVAILEET